jgi:hypothetical protein
MKLRQVTQEVCDSRSVERLTGTTLALIPAPQFKELNDL